MEVTTGWVNVTTSCQNRCLSCYRLGDVVQKPRSMPVSRAFQVIDLFGGLRVYSCILIGSEPTMYQDLDALVARAKSVGIPEVSVVTNGRLLRTESLVRRLVEAGIDVFSITIHSADPGIHDEITRVPSWHETMAGIRNAVASGVKTSLNIVAAPKNADSVRASIEPLLALGVGEIIVSCAIPRLCGDEGFDGEDALDPHRFVEIVRSLRDCPPNVVILHELPLCLLGKDLFLDLVRHNRLGFGCHVGTGRGLSVDVDGRTIPCNSFPNMGMLDLFEGDKPRFTPEEFLQTWAHAEELGELRNSVNVFRSRHCENCSLWDFCNCGCPLTWGVYKPDDYITDALVGVDAAEVAALSRIRFNP